MKKTEIERHRQYDEEAERDFFQIHDVSLAVNDEAGRPLIGDHNKRINSRTGLCRQSDASGA